MAQHIVTAPDGVKHIIVAPDTATPEEVVAYAQKTIPQKSSLDVQMDERVATERKDGGALRTFGEGLRSVANGIGMGYADEMGASIQSGLNKVSGGYLGAPYDEALAYERAYDRAVEKDQGGTGVALKMTGGIAAGFALPIARPFQGSGTLPAIANGSVNGAAYAGATGFGEGQGGVVNRLQNAKDYAKTGALAGGVLSGVASTVANRYAPTAANSIARQGDAIGVEIPQFMEGGRASQQIGAKLGAIPFVGDDVNAAVMRTRNQSGVAAENIARSMSGTGSLPQHAGEAARDALTNWTDNGARAIQQRIYAPVDRAMAGVTAPLSATARTAQQLAQEGFQAASPIHATALGEVQDALARPNGLEFQGLSRLRTQIGLMIDDKLNPTNRTSRAGLQRIYGALTDDMETAIATRGWNAGQAAWRRANGINQQLERRREAAAQIVGANGDKAGEGIIDRIVTLASTKSTANAALLEQARRTMGADAWRQVAENAIARLGRNQSNEFSPDIFLKNYTQLSHEGRRLLFNSTGNNNVLPQLEALAAVSRRLQQFSRLGNPSGTGGVAALLGAIGAAASGDMGATLATAVGGRGIGMLMSRPAVIRNVTLHARNMERLLRGQASQAAIAATASNLARAVSKETGEDQKAIELRIMSVSK